MSDSLDEIQGIFFEECAEGLAAAEAGLVAMLEGNSSPDTVASVFRAVHSIKGGSGAFGHDSLLKFSHLFENVLDDVRSGRVAPTHPVIKTLLIALDMLSDHVSAAQNATQPPEDAGVMALLEAIQRGETPVVAVASEPVPGFAPSAPPADGAPAVEPDPFGFEPVQVALETLDQPATPDVAPAEPDPFGFQPVSVDLDDLGEPAPVGPSYWKVRFEPSRAAMANGAEPVLVLRELERLGGQVVHVDMNALPELRAMDPEAAYFGWEISVPANVSRAEIDECFDFVAPDSIVIVTEAAATPPMGSAPRSEPAVEVVASDAQLPITPAVLPITPAVMLPATEPSASETASIPVQSAVFTPLSTSTSAPVRTSPSLAPVATTPAAPIDPKANDSIVQTIRVDLNRLDNLLNLVGELVIRNSILADRLTQADQERVQLSDLSRLTREIQDNVMSLRAQPIRQVFQRVPRLLRELSVSTGKQVRLETAGEHTEVDKGVIERLGDPLTHMIRNAVDHGLETPAERVAAGKSPEGVVRISAEQKGGRILVRVGDDGRGINRQKVREKAIERGIIGADAVLSDEDCDSLIMAPGFSTADTISNISGRGVGMDVVRSNVEAMGGRVEINSVPGQGTTFTMALPLTLAILDGMIVRLGSQRLVIPLSNVLEAVEPADGQVRRMTPESEVIDLRGRYLPVRRLSALFGLDHSHVAPPRAPVIIVDTDVAGHVGLMVDAIDDRREVVIKSLDANLYPIRGVAGATILGDGSIALILDIDALVASGAAGHGVRFHGKGLAA